jgi:hypothetical protein
MPKKLLLYLPVLLLANLAATAKQYDIVMDEIMADPLPSVALPNNEWIELRDTSSSAVNLQGWRIGAFTGARGLLPDIILMPDNFVVVCASGVATAMTFFGTTITISGFPSLDNEGQ